MEKGLEQLASRVPEKSIAVGDVAPDTGDNVAVELQPEGVILVSQLFVVLSQKIKSVFETEYQLSEGIRLPRAVGPTPFSKLSMRSRSNELLRAVSTDATPE